MFKLIFSPRVFAASVKLAVALAACAAYVPQSFAGEHLPVVFAPGLGMTAAEYKNYSPLVQIFQKRGYTLKIANTVSAGSIETRANSLEAQIQLLVPTSKFHLVAHSMGGIDARLALFRSDDLRARMVTLTSVSTPHRGSAAVDYLVNFLDQHGSKLIDPQMMAGLRDLTRASMADFNRETPNVPGTQYFSMGFYIPSPAIAYVWNPLILAGHEIIDNAGEGPNDGFVSAASAAWGTPLGDMKADHFSEALPIPFGGLNLRVKPIFNRVIDNLDKF